MAKPLPLNFPPVTGSPVATFDFTDIITGKGVIKFFGATTWQDNTRSYILTTNETRSQDIITSGAVIAAADMGPIATIDHEVIFQKPITFEGTALLNITIGGHGNVGGGQKIWLSGAKLVVSGASTTTDATVSVSGAMHTFAAAATEGVSQLIPLVIPKRTHIAKGDALKLALDLWAVCPASNSLDYGCWGNDPADRNDPTLGIPDAETTKLELYVPTPLDV